MDDVEIKYMIAILYRYVIIKNEGDVHIVKYYCYC